VAAVVVVFDGGDSIRWCSMSSTMDYVKVMVTRQRWQARQNNERGVHGEATQQATSSLHDEKTRGRHNKRTMRDDVTTSWRDEKS